MCTTHARHVNSTMCLKQHDDLALDASTRQPLSQHKTARNASGAAVLHKSGCPQQKTHNSSAPPARQATPKPTHSCDLFVCLCNSAAAADTLPQTPWHKKTNNSSSCTLVHVCCRMSLRCRQVWLTQRPILPMCGQNKPLASRPVNVLPECGETN